MANFRSCVDECNLIVKDGRPTAVELAFGTDGPPSHLPPPDGALRGFIFASALRAPPVRHDLPSWDAFAACFPQVLYSTRELIEYLESGLAHDVDLHVGLRALGLRLRYFTGHR